ncbi:MAG: hypothetical protein LBH69_02645 [Methanomassiliicoccaceae archaeon]|jgi:hypothetical protein|nr:hypothetical protein [Methanomassiliicoccaceae archaeon]
MILIREPMRICVNMATGEKAAIYLLFGIPGLLASGAFQTAEAKEAARQNPFYVECAYLEGEPLVHGFINLSDAKKHAVKHTVGMYRMNGQLNDKEAKIFEKGGKLIERVISGLSESEYNGIKAEREAKQDKPATKAVTSFSWNSQTK